MSDGPTERGDLSSTGPADREAQGLADAFGHLQEAALAMVAAARSALDAAERLARDPAPLLDMVAEATRAARATAPAGSAGPAAPGDPAGWRSAPAAPRVQHVVVTPPPTSAADRDD